MELCAQHWNNEFAILPARGFAKILDPIYLIRGKGAEKSFSCHSLCRRTLHIENGDKNGDTLVQSL